MADVRALTDQALISQYRAHRDLQSSTGSTSPDMGPLATELARRMAKDNPNHDEKGRFSSSDSSGSPSGSPSTNAATNVLAGAPILPSGNPPGWVPGPGRINASPVTDRQVQTLRWVTDHPEVLPTIKVTINGVDFYTTPASWTMNTGMDPVESAHFQNAIDVTAQSAAPENLLAHPGVTGLTPAALRESGVLGVAPPVPARKK